VTRSCFGWERKGRKAAKNAKKIYCFKEPLSALREV